MLIVMQRAAGECARQSGEGDFRVLLEEPDDALGPGRLRTLEAMGFVSLVTALIVCPLAGYLLSLTGLAPAGEMRVLIELSCVNGMVVLGCVLALRSVGYLMQRDTGLPRTAMASELPHEVRSPTEHAEP